jgi:hypothetical protein
MMFDPVTAVEVKVMIQKNLFLRHITRPDIPKGRNMTKIKHVLTAHFVQTALVLRGQVGRYVQ